MSIGTLIFTRLFGAYVGTDGFGNKYYRNTRKARYGRERRWVVYKGDPEASKVPAEWHAWLHHMSDAPLPEARKRPWQKPHQPNMTGTPEAYRPKGHDLAGGARARTASDYEPWQPE